MPLQAIHVFPAYGYGAGRIYKETVIYLEPGPCKHKQRLRRLFRV